VRLRLAGAFRHLIKRIVACHNAAPSSPVRLRGAANPV
jgi:hypothetical protein